MLPRCENPSCQTGDVQATFPGWYLTRGGHAALCLPCRVLDECRASFDNLAFCDIYHRTESGWRSCIMCFKALHCGCVVSTSFYFLCDTGGVICRACFAKSNVALGSSPQLVPFFYPPSPATQPILPSTNHKGLRIKSASNRVTNEVQQTLCPPISPPRPQPPTLAAPCFAREALDPLPPAIAHSPSNSWKSSLTETQHAGGGNGVPGSQAAAEAAPPTSTCGPPVPSQQPQPQPITGTPAAHLQDPQPQAQPRQTTPPPCSLPTQPFPPSTALSAQPRATNASSTELHPSSTAPSIAPAANDEAPAVHYIQDVFKEILPCGNGVCNGSLICEGEADRVCSPNVIIPEGGGRGSKTLESGIQHTQGGVSSCSRPPGTATATATATVVPTLAASAGEKRQEVKGGPPRSTAPAKAKVIGAPGWKFVCESPKNEKGGTGACSTPAQKSHPRQASNLSVPAKTPGGKVAVKSVLCKPALPKTASLRSTEQAMLPQENQQQRDMLPSPEAHPPAPQATPPVPSPPLELRPPSQSIPTICSVDGVEVKEFSEPPLIFEAGKPPSVDGSVPEYDQWVQCHLCARWRRMPARAQLAPPWKCVDNRQDPVRATCLAPQEMEDGEVDELLLLQSRHVQAVLDAEEARKKQPQMPPNYCQQTQLAAENSGYMVPLSRMFLNTAPGYPLQERKIRRDFRDASEGYMRTSPAPSRRIRINCEPPHAKGFDKEEMRSKVLRYLDGGPEWRAGRRTMQGRFLKAVEAAGAPLRKCSLLSEFLRRRGLESLLNGPS